MSYLMSLYKKETGIHRKISRLQSELKNTMKTLKQIEVIKGDSRIDEHFEYYKYLEFQLIKENRNLTDVFIKIREYQLNEQFAKAN